MSRASRARRASCSRTSAWPSCRAARRRWSRTCATPTSSVSGRPETSCWSPSIRRVSPSARASVASSSRSRSARATSSRTCSRRSPPRRPWASSRPGASTSASARCEARSSRCRPASPSSTTATTPTRFPCVPRSTTSRRTSRPGGASPCWASCWSSVRPSAPTIASSAPMPRAPASTCSSPSARCRRRSRRHSAARPTWCRMRVRQPSSPRSSSARETSCWSRRRAGSGSKRWPKRCAPDPRPARRRRAPRSRPVGEVLIAGTASLLICVFLSPKFISFLRAREFGQNIREEGPEGHHAKAGTPTMGGIIIFTAIAVPFLLLTDWDFSSGSPGWRPIGVFGTALACALLGFADDYTKLVKRRSLGLRGRTKLVVTLMIAVGLGLVATRGADLPDTLVLTLADYTLNLGYLYPVFIYLVVAGTTSAVNLTDGLDGLAAGCAAIVLLAYIAITFTIGQTGLSLVAGCLVGACVGFLWFNSFPASIFMGDTGSLGLGGAIAGMAVMTKTEVLLIILGGIFVIEALSVLIQVFSFQAFGKRVFLMAPIHHHFELQAWSETKIILRFWIVASVCAAIGFTLFQQSVS